MPYSYAVYTGNGSTTQFAITFPYIRKEHVKCYVNYVDTAYTYVNDSLIQLATAPGNGLRVEVRRVTPANNVLVDFTDGSTLVAADLDTSNLQHLYLEQELDDAFKQNISIDSSSGLPSANNQRIINVANPVNAQDAATKAYVNATVVAGLVPNGDYGDITVSSNGALWQIDAGVAVNKLANGTARQLLQTNAAGTGVEWTNDISLSGIFSASAGTAALPSITFIGDSNTGIYLPGADTLAISTNGAQRVIVNSSGALIVNDTALAINSNSRFYVNGTSEYIGASGEWVQQVATAGTGNQNLINFTRSSGSTQVGKITTDGTSTTYGTTSDYRLKENIALISNGITRLQQLKPCCFNFKTDPDRTVDGFIAHEVQEVVSEAVTGEKDQVDADGKPIYQAIDQSKLVPLLTAALQEAIAKIESLEARLTAAGID